jgi:leucine dehydrogenase
METKIQEAIPQGDAVLYGMQTLGHEQVVYCHDAETGLKAIIGIHNTVLGPALGGTRMWAYAKDEMALDDVLRLSRGMTFKAAIAGLNLGGGKAVIVGDSRTMKSEALLRRFGKFVNSLGGKYITAEDVGMGTKDMEYIGMETRHVTGLPEYLGGSGDPSPVTAYGVYMGMKAAAKFRYGNESLKGKTVVVQGAGNVGRFLVGHLLAEGAHVKIADIFEDRLKEVTQTYSGVEVIDPGNVFDTSMDIFAPCALGGIINDDTLPRLTCEIIAGGANNQLRDEKKHGEMLDSKGITYAPDFLINSGGLINVYGELKGYGKEVAMKKAEYIYGVCLDILKEASTTESFSGEVAIRFAMRRIEAMAQLNTRR